MKHLFLLLLSALTAAAADRPNIIFIMADDLGYADLGCYGQKDIRTPHLDRMAAEGLRFTQVYAGSTVCAPTRSVLMTGQHTGHTTVRGNTKGPAQFLTKDDVTLGQVMKGAGYTTGMVGKWGLGEVGSGAEPWNKGWDFFYGYLNQVNAHFFYPEKIFKNRQQIDIPENAGGKRAVYIHDRMTDEALSFVRRHRRQPFFLYLPYTVPHAELLVPEDSLAEYKGRFKEKPYVGKHYASNTHPNATLAAMITRLDRDIGRLLAQLKKLGLDDNTLVFFTSDNGPAEAGGRDAHFFDSNGPLRGIKRDVYEGGIRVPMIARWPGKIPAGQTSDAVWAFWDVLPTLAHLGGGKAPRGIDGVNIAPALFNAKHTLPARFLYWEFHERGYQQAARWQDWKVVRPQLNQPLELYHLAKDLGETNNVAKQHPDIVQRFEAYLSTARTDSPNWVPKERKSKKKKKRK